jgi:hypothetical protein
VSNQQADKNREYIDDLMRQLRPPLPPIDTRRHDAVINDPKKSQSDAPNPPPNPLLIPRRQDDGSGTTIDNVIIVFSGTGYYCSLSGKITGPV